MLLAYENGVTSVVLRVKLTNSSTGAALTGLTSASAGLIISTIANNEATPTVYAQASSNIETITTLGTFAAPSSGKCRFKEVDATNHPGVYEIQIADARFAVSSARHLLISISGATNLLDCHAVIQHKPVPANLTQTNGTNTSVLSSVDGITFESLMELLLAFIAGKITVTDNGDGTDTYVYKKQDGTTTKLTVTANNTTGARAAGGTIV